MVSRRRNEDIRWQYSRATRSGFSDQKIKRSKRGEQRWIFFLSLQDKARCTSASFCLWIDSNRQLFGEPSGEKKAKLNGRLIKSRMFQRATWLNNRPFHFQTDWSSVRGSSEGKSKSSHNFVSWQTIFGLLSPC